MTRLRWITRIHISFLIGVTHSHFSVENLGSSSSASTHSTVVDCGTASPTDDERIEMSQVFEQWLERNPDRNLRIMSLTYVPVYFHVLKPNDRVGSVSSKVVNRFLTRLNLKMQNTPFIFELFDIEEVIEPNWAECDQEDMFKSALRRGGVESLNVYFCDLMKSRNMAGMTYLPPVSIDYSYLDGIMLMNPTLGSSEAHANRMIETFIHETGHWLGLFHTFENGCSDSSAYLRTYNEVHYYFQSSDGVPDTPAHALPTMSNYAGEDSCWNLNPPLDTCVDGPGIDNGTDPVHNYMNYLPYQCRKRYGEFTRGQVDRMIAEYQAYRSDECVLERRCPRYSTKNSSSIESDGTNDDYLARLFQHIP